MTRSEEQPGASMTASAQTTAAELAVVYVKERRYDDALRYFQQAGVLSPEARSYYGLALAMRRQVDDAVQYCREAVDQEPLRGDLYHNLGQVHLVRGEKHRAVRAFLSGLQAEPRHRGLTAALRQLGVREPPPVQFLSRTNPINKYLGWVRHRVKKAG